MDNKTFREVLQDILASLSGGSTLGDAVARHPKVFPPFYIGVLRSAEATGDLDAVLDQLGDYIERDLDARRKITSALIYPGVVVCLAVVVVVVLTGYVLPRFETFFKELHAHLPLATRVLLAMAHFVQHQWYVFVALALLLVIAGLWMMRTEKGRDVRDRMLLRLPAVGSLVRHAMLERFCRTLGSMVRTGVPLPEAMLVTTQAMSNSVFRDGLTKARASMMRGEGLAGPLAETGLFPSSAKQMLRVGESTGSLDQQLATAATYFDRELDHEIKRFTSLFEPVVILFVGVIVGFVAIALVSAMYGIYRQVGTTS
jgi:type IV pilus assembly protein PilC